MANTTSTTSYLPELDTPGAKRARSGLSRSKTGALWGHIFRTAQRGGRGHPQIEVTGLLAVEANTKYPLDFDGGHSTGIGYEFHNGYCNHAMLFVDGAVRCESWWRSTGILLAYNRSGEFFENYRWLANGKMDSATVAAAPLRIMFNVFDSGELQSLIIDGDVRSRLPDLAQLEHFPVKPGIILAACAAERKLSSVAKVSMTNC